MSTASEFLINESFNNNRSFESSAKALANAFLAGRTNAKGVQLEAAKTALVNQQLADLQRKQQKEADEQAAFERSLQGLEGAFDPANRKEIPRLDPNMQGPLPQETLMQSLASPHGQAALTNAATDFIRGGQKADEFGDLARVIASFQGIGQGGKLDSLIQSTRSAAGDTPLGQNQALSLEGQQDIFDRNQEADPVDAKKIALNNFINNLSSGKGNTPEETAAFMAASPNTIIPPTIANSSEDLLAPTAPLPKEQTIFGQVEQATGPVSGAISTGSQVAGLFGFDVGGDVIRARQEAEIFSTRLIPTLRATGGKFAEGERLNLQKIIAITPDFWTAPLVAEKRMIAMDRGLRDAELQNLADLNDPLLTKTARSAASSNLRAIKQARQTLGVPVELRTGRRPDNTIDDFEHEAAVKPVVPQGTDEIPEGVDPADWEFLTPSERALWQR